MRNFIKYCFLIFAFSQSGNYLFAQDSLGSIRLHEVEITAVRPITEKGMVITRMDSISLEQNRQGSLSDLLAFSSTVFIKSYGESGMSSASFRGTAASHTKVEWNGMEINNPMLGQTDFSLLPVFFADEVCLFHGGSSLVNGSGALGGSITMNSKASWNEPSNFSIVQSFGSFNTSKTLVKAGIGNRKMKLVVRANNTFSENDFIFYNTANGLWNYEKQKNAGFNKKGILADTYFNTGKNSFFSVHFWHQTADRKLPAIMSYQGEGREENQFDRETRFSAKWQKFSKKWKTEILSGFSATQLNYFLANNTAGGYLLNYDSESNTTGIINKIKSEYSLGEKTVFKGTINFNYFKANYLDKKLQTGYNAGRTESGAGFSVHQELNDRFQVFGLIRSEITDGEFLPLMPSIGFEYSPGKIKDLFVKSSVTRNYHKPSLNDLYWIPGGNPDLKPERGYTGDLSFGYCQYFQKNSFIKPEINGYFSKIDDWIIWRPGDYRFWQAENLQTVLSRGVESRLMSGFDRGLFKLRLSATYSYTRTSNISEGIEFSDAVSTQLVYIPVHSANTLTKVFYKGFYAVYTYSYTGERFTNSSNEETRHSLPGFGLHGITIGKEFTVSKMPSEIQLAVNNIFNTDYQTILWRAMPGRNFMLTLKIGLERKNND